MKIVIAVIVTLFIIVIAEYLTRKRYDQMLPESPGREIVQRHCLSCHSPSPIVSGRRSREMWHSTVVWMQKMQGMTPIPENELEPLLDYLETNFNKIPQ